jgi:hypothetical protein
MNFFETATRNLLSYEAAAGVKHHVALSVVGSERLVESGYLRAKIAQENLIKGGSIPIPLFAQRGSSNSSRASPIFPLTATKCACHRRSSSLWRPTMSPVR